VSRCDCWTHTQHVTDSRCDHCGAAVPIVTFSCAEYDASQREEVLR